MIRSGTLAVAMSLLILGVGASGVSASPQEQASVDVDRVNAANQDFIEAIAARDIGAMDKVWAHETYTTFIEPLSTMVVIGWEGVRKAWEMRFGQMDQVIISLAESHVRINGKVAWAVGTEKVKLLRKRGDPLTFDTFVTNVFENHDDRWLLVSHQATPMFREGK